MKSRILGALAIGLGMVTQFANAQITYEVDRVVGAGTVTGFIETDGTIGGIDSSNILSWELTLTAPNLASGSSVTISSLSQQQTLSTAGVVTASATELMFDISGGSGDGLFLVQAPGFGDFYCLETAGGFCTGAGIGEHIGV